MEYTPDGFFEWALQNGDIDIQSDEEWAKINDEQ